MWDENKVRIVDVADALGLSTATVSNVIHGKTKKISDGTVRRVQEKLREMGVERLDLFEYRVINQEKGQI